MKSRNYHLFSEKLRQSIILASESSGELPICDVLRKEGNQSHAYA